MVKNSLFLSKGKYNCHSWNMEMYQLTVGRFSHRIFCHVIENRRIQPQQLSFQYEHIFIIAKSWCPLPAERKFSKQECIPVGCVSAAR